VKISLFTDNVRCKPVEVGSMKELSAHLTKGFGWSPAVFKDNYRTLENFQQMEVVALDFDEGLSLAEASLIFSGYQHIIGTSRNHGKEKVLPSGKTKPARDRFRVVFRLSAPITADETYRATFEALRQKFPAADPVCCNADRFFYPCTEIFQGDDNGQLIDPVVPPPKVHTPRRELSEGDKGKLARSTLEFITVGTVNHPKGRHAQLFKAAKDFQEQGFDQEDAIEQLMKCPLVDSPGLPAYDFEKAVKSAYKKEPKYEPRQFDTGSPDAVRDRPTDPGQEPTRDTKNTGSLQSLALLDEALAHLANPEAVKGTSTGWPDIDNLLGGLRQSELGIIQAYPKSGKTVLLTNLMCNLTAQGHKVGFASLEMHPAQQVEPDLYSLLLKKDIRKGVNDEDKDKLRQLLNGGRGLTYFKRDRRPTEEEICNWVRACYRDQGIRFFFIDHFHKFVRDESSVAAIGRAITALTGVKYECPEIFMALIVQPTKEQRSRDGVAERVGKNTLRGGAVIFDECDWLINMHTKYSAYKVHEKPWGESKEHYMASYPNDIRELEFEAIRAKPFSENMGKRLHMKYDKGTTAMSPYKWIAPEPERIEMPQRDDKNSNYCRTSRGSGGGQASGWATDWQNRKKIYKE
jgi:KaiC/GvpD/RAD55 family RecA-like ATPase